MKAGHSNNSRILIALNVLIWIALNVHFWQACSRSVVFAAATTTTTAYTWCLGILLLLRYCKPERTVCMSASSRQTYSLQYIIDNSRAYCNSKNPISSNENNEDDNNINRK